MQMNPVKTVVDSGLQKYAFESSTRQILQHREQHQANSGHSVLTWTLALAAIWIWVTRRKKKQDTQLDIQGTCPNKTCSQALCVKSGQSGLWRCPECGYTFTVTDSQVCNA